MHIAKLQEKKDKFKHDLGRLQEGLRYLPHSSIIAKMETVGLADNVIGFIKQSMETQLISWWKTTWISAY